VELGQHIEESFPEYLSDSIADAIVVSKYIKLFPASNMAEE
jgi:hypothetical protein